MVNGGQRPDFGGQRSDSLQIYILGISIPNARCMQNLGSIRPLGAILGLPSHIKVEVAVPLLLHHQYLYLIFVDKFDLTLVLELQSNSSNSEFSWFWSVGKLNKCCDLRLTDHLQ